MYMNVASAEYKYLIYHFNIIIYKKKSFKLMVALLHRMPLHMIWKHSKSSVVLYPSND